MQHITFGGNGRKDKAMVNLYDEAGAVDFDIKPICVYSVAEEGLSGSKETFGMLYYAEIRKFEKELHSKIEKIQITDQLPDEWTYPEIQPVLIKEAKKRGYWKS